VALLATCAGWLVQRARALRAAGAVLLVTVVLHLGALRLFTQFHSGDAGALAFLKKVWVAPNGTTLSLKP
ncbi:MAG: hypothetical protein JNG84_03575, partial [Archangium sp.]|nr:hypothetical protein [Archangium sp.]